MTTALRIVAGVVIAIGLAEMALTALAALSGMVAWGERFTDLTRIEAPTSLRLAVGVLAGVSAVSLGLGYARPGWWIVGGAVLALYAGAVLVRQISLGDTGASPLPYLLFTTCGVVSVVAGVAAA